MLMEMGYQRGLLTTAARTVDKQALQLYRNARFAATVKSALATVTRASRDLPMLRQSGARGSHVGAKTVALSQVRGSEDRRGDFDIDFLPLHDGTANRWQSVAGARLGGRVLPPVQLLQVGDIYFVRDGHHRISVARALGEIAIEAEVTLAA